jgi:WD40 repeat protein
MFATKIYHSAISELKCDPHPS